MPQTASAALPGSGGGDRTLVVVADGWGASFGGINAFNLDFCLALGRLLRGAARVICLTTPVGGDTRVAVADQGVELVSIERFDADARTVQAGLEVLRRTGADRPDLIIGHDVKTGPVSLALRAAVGGAAKAAVIHHMSYGSYHGLKGEGRATREKEDEQRRLLRAADFVLAVGPLLRASAERLCQTTRPVTMLVPGLPDILPIVHREGQFRGIAFGRMGKEDDRIKQGRLAAAGYGRFIRKAEVLDLGRDYRFNVFGLSGEECASEEAEVKALVIGEAGREVHVVACPYTQNREALFEALADNEVAMMLSWHEGFGLVGWEAIAAQVPLVVSKATGLYRLLRDERDTFGSDCVTAVDVRGTDQDHPSENDIEAVANALQSIAVNLDRSIARAVKLRLYLRATYTWEGCARTALEACGWGDLLPPMPAPAPAPLPSTAPAVSAPSHGSFTGLLGQANELLVPSRGYLAGAACAAATWYAVRTSHGPPAWWLTALLVAVPLAIAFLTQTLPAIRAERRQRRLGQLSLAVKPGYFRLDPRPDTAEEHAKFTRADGIHRRIADWVRDSTEPLLYLTGRSGCGKSSIVSAYLPRELKKAGIRCVRVRTFTALGEELRQYFGRRKVVWRNPPPLGDLSVGEMLRLAATHLRERGERLVLIIDQFEELFVLDRHETGERTAIQDILRSQILCRVDGLTILLVMRFDYVGEIEPLGLPRFREWINWADVPPFTKPDGNAFLQQGHIPPDDAIGLVDQASELDDIPLFVRPVTLNMLGLIYVSDPTTGAKLSQRKGTRKGLLLHYLRQHIQAGDLRDIAPRILRAMIAEGGVRMMAIAEAALAEANHLPLPTVKGALRSLQQEGVVRPVGTDRWEIAHDFLVGRLNVVLETIERSRHRTIQPWLPAVALVGWSCAVALGLLVVLPVPEQSRHQLQVARCKTAFYEAKGEVSAQNNQRVYFRGGKITPDAVRYLHHLDRPPEELFIVCFRCPSESVQAIGELPSIRILDLVGSVDLDDAAVTALVNLPHLESLSLTLWREDAEQILANCLPRFSLLRNLQIGGARNSLVSAIEKMPRLELLGLRLHKMDAAGLAELQRKRPDLMIVIDNYHPLRGEESKKDRKVILPVGKKKN